MYLPHHFAERRPEELHRLVQEFPLGTLVTHGASGLDANHIPLELDVGRGALGTLQGHIARANPLWKEVADGADVLVIFHGAEGYISPSWYPSKHETHRHVPTWNYEVVHAHGKLRVIDDVRFVRGIVARLTRRHEAAELAPWKMGDAPADYLDENLKMIVGIEVEITRLEGKRKLGQNREARDLQGAVDALRERGKTELSEAMASVAAPHVRGARR
jgi:transcriptional regulator